MTTFVNQTQNDNTDKLNRRFKGTFKIIREHIFQNVLTVSGLALLLFGKQWTKVRIFPKELMKEFPMSTTENCSFISK